MATYKVLQDIEAEDKFLGPLTLKQFIFGAIALVSGYLSFLFITKGIPLLAIPFFPVVLISGFLAFPWGRDQPTETWLLAKLRFYFKPRKRIWDQTGIQELVKITVPKKIEQFTSDNLSQEQVLQRLQALAETIDTRGWATKNVLNVSNTAQGSIVTNQSDRLLAPTIIPSSLVQEDTSDLNDIFDESKTMQLTAKIDENIQKHKAEAIEQMNTVQDSSSNWFMDNKASQSTELPPAFRKEGGDLSDSEKAFLEEVHENKAKYNESFRSHKIISPISENTPQKSPAATVTGALDPVTIELARNNDRTVESLARETNEVHKQQLDDEVTVSLH
jgi:hypothetical protein